ncbi:FAD-dependent oxidoreductase [Roseibium salinum]|nr:FAD-dependent oxidoreductase [Roseibium salinum]
MECLQGESAVSGVKLTTGEVIPAELVLIAVGAEPNDQLAAEAGLDVDNGVLVDGCGQTSDPDIYAVGDCTRFYSNRYKRSVRMESVQNAIDQAKIAAQSLLGEDVDYDPLPWFWSDQYDIKLQIAGLSEGYDTTVVTGSPESHKFYVAYLKEKPADRCRQHQRGALAHDGTPCDRRDLAGRTPAGGIGQPGSGSIPERFNGTERGATSGRTPARG